MKMLVLVIAFQEVVSVHRTPQHYVILGLCAIFHNHWLLLAFAALCW